MIQHNNFTYRKQRKEMRHSSSVELKADVAIAKTFAIIFVCFAICWIPAQLVLFIVGLTENINFFDVWYLKLVHVMAICLAHFNSAINPLVFAYRMENIRVIMKKVLGIKSRNDASSKPSRAVGTLKS